MSESLILLLRDATSEVTVDEDVVIADEAALKPFCTDDSTLTVALVKFEEKLLERREASFKLASTCVWRVVETDEIPFSTPTTIYPPAAPAATEAEVNKVLSLIFIVELDDEEEEEEEDEEGEEAGTDDNSIVA